ncbi:hypothetical protein GUJ93_ZPchr0007g4141 [Zizania palustris]|uniref:Uncharacterized protein n=1 Tax=Zizania palustris TaxID=103762 RepID=A0A8J5TC80_ZIZPA|nr:hypothetical protein GUJ93_ZPchr0007g4141 [Zizania palustris]
MSRYMGAGFASKQLWIAWPLNAATAVALVAATVVSISAIVPRLGAVVSFFWSLLVSTGFFLVAIAVLLRISPPPASAIDKSGKELIDFVAGCRPEHHPPDMAATVDVPPETEI